MTRTYRIIIRVWDHRKFYITTPIYYVNDRPHIGHLYTTTIADIVARYHRLIGHNVFFLTGTDEHATKVVDAASARGLSPQQWANQNAKVFEDTFSRLGISNNDFIRTSQERHKKRVTQTIRQLVNSGDVYVGEYEGWYDAGQEEYLPENKAKEYEYKSPVNNKPLVRKSEKNYFFKLSRYSEPLLKLMKEKPAFVQPDARRNEVIGRIREGLNDIPISRTGAGGWGIAVPDDPDQTVYVWIDALFNYRTAIHTPDREDYWPADVHLIAKDILWFHAVIWPAMLMALNLPLPQQVYAHSFWISEGQKMSKSLGNFIDLEKIDHYVETFSLDALRYFLATTGPMGTTDSDFAETKFIDVYNADLANTLGNCFSRITNMTNRYFNGTLPEHGPTVKASENYRHTAERSIKQLTQAMKCLQLEQATASGVELVRSIDNYIEQTQPFKMAKDKTKLPEVGTILYNCVEAMRIASLLLWPVMPSKIETLWERIGCDTYTHTLMNRGTGSLGEWGEWGQLQPGTPILQGDPLFPRYQPHNMD